MLCRYWLIYNGEYFVMFEDFSSWAVGLYHYPYSLLYRGCKFCAAMDILIDQDEGFSMCAACMSTCITYTLCSCIDLLVGICFYKCMNKGARVWPQVKLLLLTLHFKLLDWTIPCVVSLRTQLPSNVKIQDSRWCYCLFMYTVLHMYMTLFTYRHT